MSLDEIRKILEERERKKQLDNTQNKKNKETSKKRTRSKKKSSGSKKPKKSEEISFNIGEMTLNIKRNIFQDLLQTMWQIDKPIHSELDKTVMKYFDSAKNQLPLKFDRQKLYQKIRQNSYFQLSHSQRIPYHEIRQNWQTLIQPYPDLKMPSPRKEFVQLIKNSLKSRWVHQDGTPLSEGEFQILYRLEREPKAIERMVEYLENNWMEFVKEESFQYFVQNLRINIAKIIKEELLKHFRVSKPAKNEEPQVIETSEI